MSSSIFVYSLRNKPYERQKSGQLLKPTTYEWGESQAGKHASLYKSAGNMTEEAASYQGQKLHWSGPACCCWCTLLSDQLRLHLFPLKSSGTSHSSKWLFTFQYYLPAPETSKPILKQLPNQIWFPSPHFFSTFVNPAKWMRIRHKLILQDYSPINWCKSHRAQRPLLHVWAH